MTEFDLGKVVGDDGTDGTDGVGIASISKTGTSGKTDTYTITYTDGDTDTFTITNGSDGQPGQDGQDGATGNGISKIELYSTSGKTKTYRITYTNGNHFDFTVTDGNDASVTIVTSFGSTTSDSKVPSEKLVKNSLDAKADTSSVPSDVSDLTDTTGVIPTDVSDLTDTSSTAFTPKSHQHGSITNDGKIGTTSGLPVKTGTGGALTTGAFGTSAGQFAEGNHTHSAYVNPTIADNLTTDDATQVLSAKQGKVLKDLIGEAINYINL